MSPDVICNATSLMSWWVRHTLPAETYEKLAEAGSGPWVPMHLSLTHGLMRAVKKSGIDTRVVNCSFPDGVNPMRARTTGMRAPYWIRIFADDRDVTELLPKDKLRELVMKARSRGTGATGWSGPPPQQATASSFLRNVLAIYFDKKELLHASGPKGLPGGYPVRLSYDAVDVVIPEGLTLEDAVRINEDGAKFDGIQEIKGDGTLVLTDTAAKIMRDTLGYEREEYRLSESTTIAKELLSLVKKRKMG
jgi:hypothetical protein